MSEKIRSDVAEIPVVRAPSDWKKTKIGNWGDGALVKEVERIERPDWWLRDEPRDASGRPHLRLVDRSGKKGFFQDGEEEPDQHGKNREARAAEGLDDEELLPNDTETIVQYLARLAVTVDVNDGPNKILFDGLRGYASRFRGDALARNLDSTVVATFLKKALEGSGR
jgi:hypothetical protein